MQHSAKQSQAAIVYTLDELGLTGSQSSHYQREASVPAEVYERWVQRIMESDDEVLSAEGLRDLARQRKKSGEGDAPRLPFAKAEVRIRRLLATLCKEMDADGRALLPGLLKTLSRECKGD